MRDRNSIAIFVILHKDCNMRCTYCYEKKGRNSTKMSDKTVYKMFDFVRSELDNDENNDKREIHITLFGGEPTLNPEAIDLIINEMMKFKQENYFANLSMISNGLEFPSVFEKRKDELNELLFTVQLSIDGPEETENKQRPLASWYRKQHGKINVSKEVTKNAKKYIELYGERRVMLHSVVTKHTLKDMYSIYMYYFNELKSRNSWIILARDYLMEDKYYKIYDQQLGKILKQISKTKDLEALNLFSHFSRNENASLSKRFGLDEKNKPCGAGDGFYSVDPEGEIYGCHHFSFLNGDDRISIGNLDDGIDEKRQQVFADYDFSDIIQCKNSNCTLKSTCYHCIADNFVESGSLFSTGNVTKSWKRMAIIDRKYVGLAQDLKERWNNGNRR